MIEATFYGEGKQLCFKNKTPNAVQLELIEHHHPSIDTHERICSLLGVVQTLSQHYPKEVKSQREDVEQMKKTFETLRILENPLNNKNEGICM